MLFKFLFLSSSQKTATFCSQIAQTIFQYEPTYDKIFAAMNSSNYFDKKDVQLYKAFDVNGKEYPIAGDPGDISLSTLRAAGFRDKPELTWQAGE